MNYSEAKTTMKNSKNIPVKFSFFESPIKNTKPYRNITLYDAFRAITSDYLKEPTQQLRLIKGKDENRTFKATNFSYVTFSGSFTHRNEKGLIKHSGFIAIDFDHLENVKAVKLQLLKDPCFETELLFTSPNGNGLKWVIPTDTKGKLSHGEFFDAVRSYVQYTHRIEVDKSGRDVARACFLCHDPEAFLHPKYLINETTI